MNRYTTEMKLWLFDIAHGNLETDDVVSGFIKHYVLYNRTMQNVQDDILFHTSYGKEGAVAALSSISEALNYLIQPTHNKIFFSEEKEND